MGTSGLGVLVNGPLQDSVRFLSFGRSVDVERDVPSVTGAALPWVHRVRSVLGGRREVGLETVTDFWFCNSVDALPLGALELRAGLLVALPLL